VYAILENDHWTDAKLIADLFQAEGIRMLINEGSHRRAERSLLARRR
jgi:hypothetical protein